MDTRQPLTLESETGAMTEIKERSELLINEGDGTFVLTDESNTLRRSNRQDVPAGAAFVDVNRDGNLDLWVAQGGLGAPMQDRLYLGDGLGGFEDVTNEIGVRTQTWVQADTINSGQGHSTAWSSAACDLNNDGYPELLIGSYGRAPNHLWRAEIEEGG